MVSYRYVLCDVFSDQPLAGNPLAVFTRANDLSSETMQAIAREMNLSETAFVSRPSSGGHARIRIFTPTHEVPFAGHPVLGTAVVLGGALQAEVVRLETGRGVIDVRLERDGARIVFGWMQQPVPTVSDFALAPQLLEALGVAGPTLPIELYDNGPRHALVCVADRSTVAQLKPDQQRLAELPVDCISVFAGEQRRYKTRVFAPRAGVAEDPATGSAAGPVAFHLVRHGLLMPGEDLQIEQGVELARPSILIARVEGSARQPDAIVVGGAAVVVGRGELLV